MPFYTGLCEGAVMLALALVLNALKLYQFPNGGSIDLAMIPIFFFALRWGCGWGLLEGFLFGLLQMFIDGAVAWGWQSLLLDYLVAFTPAGPGGPVPRQRQAHLRSASCWAVWRGSSCISSAASPSTPSTPPRRY
jgi:energy-coupled thiamine transporter ThiT